ncbi:hypothetical protein HYH02_001896 [Chlamydomonas schloesseri]|nr:hypothetical protein HYH02_001896 [Chlamydomonas schloesseri]|eukprot:KAG2453683.1 hypothetical protein HYH02_001896 [Chlamydomonas schloesseri]
MADEEDLLYEEDYPDFVDEADVEAGLAAQPTEDAGAPPAGAEEQNGGPGPGEDGGRGDAAAGGSGADKGEEAAARAGGNAGPSGRVATNGGPHGFNARGRPGAAAGGEAIRYFIIRSNSLQNIFISVRTGAWATTRTNDPKLDAAFRSSAEVRLIFSVMGTSAFQGYATMRTAVGAFPKPVVWENGQQFGRPFGVEWRVLFELPHDDCNHIRNRLNDNKVVYVARDCTELPQEQGDQLTRLMAERAAAAGAKPPRQQLAMLEASGRVTPPAMGPGGGGPGRMAGPRGGPMGIPMGMGGPRPRGPGMGPPGIRPGMGPGMDPMAAIMGGPVGPMGPGALLGPGGPGMAGPPGFNMDALATAMALNTFNPAALGAMLQQAGGMMGGPLGGVAAGPSPAMQAIASAMVAHMSNLPPEQQAMAMATIGSSNPLLAEAVAAVIASGGPVGGMGMAGPGGMLGGGGGGAVMVGGGPGPRQGLMMDGGPMGGIQQQQQQQQQQQRGGGGMGMGGSMGMMGQQQQQQQQQRQSLQEQQAMQQLMNMNRDDVVLEGSDGRLRSGRARSRSRSRSPVAGRRGGGGGGPPDFSSMTYDQYLQQYGRVMQEVQQRVGPRGGGGGGGAGWSQRGRSTDRSPQHVREPTPSSQGVGARGGVGDGSMPGGGGAGGAGMASKPGGQPYTEEE